MSSFLPKHLKHLGAPNKMSADETEVRLDVVCPCGGSTVNILFVGDLILEPDTYIEVAEIGDDFFQIFKVRCVSCGKVHVIFDRDFHGWQGIVAPDEIQVALKRPVDSEFFCTECSGGEFRVGINLIYFEKTYFAEERSNGQGLSEWADAYSGISVDASCLQCGRKYEPLTDSEAS